MFALKRFIALFIVLATTGSPFVLAAASANENTVKSESSLEDNSSVESASTDETATVPELDGKGALSESHDVIEQAVATESVEAPGNEAPITGKAKPVQQPAAQPPVKVNGVSSLLSVFVGLLFILGLILALAWFVKRIGQGGITANNHLRIVASLPLGTRERLALVDVGGKQILLGLTPQNINTLHVFDEPVIDSASAEPSEFALKLRSLLNPAAKNNQTTEHHR